MLPYGHAPFLANAEQIFFLGAGDGDRPFWKRAGNFFRSSAVAVRWAQSRSLADFLHPPLLWKGQGICFFCSLVREGR